MLLLGKLYILKDNVALLPIIIIFKDSVALGQIDGGMGVADAIHATLQSMLAGVNTAVNINLTPNSTALCCRISTP